MVAVLGRRIDAAWVFIGRREGALERLARIHHEVSGLGVEGYSHGAARTLLAQRIVSPLCGHVAALHAILDELRALRGAAARTSGRWTELFDVVEAARLDLFQVERRLRSGGRTHDDRLTACDSARRRVCRVTVALRLALGRALGREVAVPDAAADLEVGLSVRQTYARLREALATGVPGEPLSVRRALRMASSLLAVLLSSERLGDLRRGDRLLLLSLQSRFLAWVRAGGAAEDGVRLLLDARGATELLRCINRRAELLEHDARVVAAQATRLREAGGIGEVLDVIASLRCLRGRDDEIDRLLERALGEAPLAEIRPALLGALHRLAKELPVPR